MDDDLFRFEGQAGYIYSSRRVRTIRIAFAMIDRPRKNMAWYLFNSVAFEKLAHPDRHPDPMPPEMIGFRVSLGRDIPHTFQRKIGLTGLAKKPEGTSAVLTLEATKRFLECRISNLQTHANEFVSFPFGMQYDSVSLKKAISVHGKVSFIYLSNFEERLFVRGPRSPSLPLPSNPVVPIH
jgi:hypothetical protein